MGKTWKKSDGHGNHADDYRSKGEEYGHKNRSNYYKETLHENDNSRFNHRSMKKAMKKRQEFEDAFLNGTLDF